MRAQSVIEAQAPGKLFVSGEYAVLAGAPAIACAVSRYVSVRVRKDGIGEKAEAAQWREAAERVLAEHGLGGHAAGGTLEIDSRSLYSPSGTKYGMGSSAAVAVGVTGALLAAGGSLPDAHAQMRIATALHRARQGGGGSGVDVAASLYGGVVAVSGDRVESLRWPAGLLCAVIWSGQDADTRQAVVRFRTALKSGSSTVGAALERLAGAAAAVTAAWRQGAQSALGALEQYGVAWQALDRSAHLDIYSRPHRELLSLAADAGCVYKPSGAGGGDCGLAFAVHGERLKAMCESACKAGYAPLEQRLATPGMSARRYRE